VPGYRCRLRRASSRRDGAFAPPDPRGRVCPEVPGPRGPDRLGDLPRDPLLDARRGARATGDAVPLLGPAGAHQGRTIRRTPPPASAPRLEYPPEARRDSHRGPSRDDGWSSTTGASGCLRSALSPGRSPRRWSTPASPTLAGGVRRLFALLQEHGPERLSGALREAVERGWHDGCLVATPLAKPWGAHEEVQA
jgi:hypothetical protein